MDKELAAHIGKIARLARIKRGLTQAQVAEAIKVEPEFYGRIERGQALPSMGKLKKMADVLDVSADALLGNEEYEGGEGEDGAG